jgi:plasmid stabilization system protein ParE
LRWTRLADADLDDIAAYVGQDSPAAAARVILELIERAEILLLRVLHTSRRWPEEGMS